MKHIQMVKKKKKDNIKGKLTAKKKKTKEETIKKGPWINKINFYPEVYHKVPYKGRLEPSHS